ncbi:MAG TPA: hypothetical protein VGC16_02580 [Rhizomicrobium sp.]
MTNASSNDLNPVIVDDVSPTLIVAVLAGFWVLIGVLGYLALG